jgi:hypothetical protein
MEGELVGPTHDAEGHRIAQAAVERVAPGMKSPHEVEIRTPIECSDGATFLDPEKAVEHERSISKRADFERWLDSLEGGE